MVTKVKELSKDIGVKLYKVDNVISNDDKGNAIKCPTLAYVHITVDSGFGDLILRGFRVLRGTSGDPFVARPGRTRKLYDETGKQVSTQRFNDIRIDGNDDVAFEAAFKERILAAYKS